MHNDASSGYSGNTLLEYIINDAIELAATKSSDRLRFSTNLDAQATRAVFAGTEKRVSNGGLLRILRPKTVSGAVGRDTKEARNLRSVGGERSLKIDRVKMYVVALLDSEAISKADAVRAWAYALIHESARLSIAEARTQLGRVNPETINAQPGLGNQLLNRCYEILMKQVQSRFDKSSADVELKFPFSEQRAFLDYAAGMVIDSMQQPLHPWAAVHNLLSNVYPEIDLYEFGLEEDA